MNFTLLLKVAAVIYVYNEIHGYNIIYRKMPHPCGRKLGGEELVSCITWNSVNKANGTVTYHEIVSMICHMRECQPEQKVPPRVPTIMPPLKLHSLSLSLENVPILLSLSKSLRKKKKL